VTIVTPQIEILELLPIKAQVILKFSDLIHRVQVFSTNMRSNRSELSTTSAFFRLAIAPAGTGL